MHFATLASSAPAALNPFLSAVGLLLSLSRSVSPSLNFSQPSRHRQSIASTPSDRQVRPALRQCPSLSLTLPARLCSLPLSLSLPPSLSLSLFLSLCLSMLHPHPRAPPIIFRSSVLGCNVAAVQGVRRPLRHLWGSPLYDSLLVTGLFFLFFFFLSFDGCSLVFRHNSHASSFLFVALLPSPLWFVAGDRPLSVFSFHFLYLLSFPLDGCFLVSWTCFPLSTCGCPLWTGK